MVIDNYSGGSDAIDKVGKNESEVSCWNCFNGVTAENDAEPATLPKIRRETRTKYRLYSFLASQISKPKAMPLTQKVSENYAIGKTVEKKIVAKAKKDKNDKSITSKYKNSTKFELNPTSDTSVDTDGDSNTTENKTNVEGTFEYDKGISEYIKEYNLFEAYKTIRRKTPTPNGTLQRSQSLNVSNFSKNETINSVDKTDSQSQSYNKLEIFQPKITIKKVYESPKIHITANTYITKSEENLLSNVNIPRSPINRSLSRNDSTTSLGLNSSIRKSLSKNVLDKKEKLLSRISEKPYLSGNIKTDAIKLPQTTEFHHSSVGYSDNIVHSVQIETSTPKTKHRIVTNDSHIINQNDVIIPREKNNEIERIIEGIHNITLENKDQVTVEKVEIASTNGSESGYSGSSIRELNEPDFTRKNATSKRSIESGNETESPQLSNRSPHPTFKSSLPAYSRRSDMMASTKSLSADADGKVKKPVKQLRWSTLLPSKPDLYNDEVYLSDNNISSGHATLPRRSNSPLPHDRELDRDRLFPNRSGLQARSESMASVYSGAGEGTRANVTVRGEIQFSLLYNYRLKALEVGVKGCRDLAAVDVKRNRSDPYVKMYLLPDKSKTGKRKTKVKKNTLNPVFEETLSFAQPLASLSARTLWLSVWHADMFGRNDFLGEVTLPLCDVVFDDPAPTWYKLHERTEQFDEQQGTRGDLIIGLKFELHESGAMRGKGTLHVLVKEAKNLVATKPNGLADVFCKSYLLPERGRLAKQKTNVVRRSLNPRWEHTFTYRGLKPQELSTRALELSLWDRDRLASNDFMGAIRLSLGTGTYMGANVNWMDSVGKECTLWQTMMQRPNFWVEGSLPLRPQLNN